MNVSREKWKSKKRHKKSNTAQNERVQLPPSDLEIHLLAQRQRHQMKPFEADCNVSNPTVGSIMSIPGLKYDASSDRYFKTSHTPQLKATRCQTDSSLLRCDKGSKCHSIIQLLSSRNVLTYGNHQSSRNLTHSKFSAVSFLMKPRYNLYNNVSEADQFPDADASFHHIHGIARTSSRAITMYHPSNQRHTSVSLSSFTRLRGSSNPHWRPTNIGNSDEQPALAVLIHSGIFVQTVLLQLRSSEQSVNSSGLYSSSWKTSKIGGLTCRDQGSVENIKWTDSGHQLLMLCDSGIWITNIERSSTNITPESNLNTAEVPYNRSSIIMCNGNHTENTTAGHAVTICNAKRDEHVKFVGFRNGNLTSLDTRSRSIKIDIGKLPYCIDHIESLHDDITLVAQDITGKISLYDCRMPSRTKNTEYSCITYGLSTDVRKKRRFWLSPDERIIVAPSHKRPDTVLWPDKDDPSSLTSYSLNFNARIDDVIRSYGGCKVDESNILATHELNISLRHHQIDRSRQVPSAVLGVMPSSVKVSSHSGGIYESGDVDDLCSGLYCVANVACTGPIRRGPREMFDAVGSVLFKASCARTQLQ